MDAPSLQALINTANTNIKSNNVNANNKKDYNLTPPSKDLMIDCKISNQ